MGRRRRRDKRECRRSIGVVGVLGGIVVSVGILAAAVVSKVVQ